MMQAVTTEIKPYDMRGIKTFAEFHSVLTTLLVNGHTNSRFLVTKEFLKTYEGQIRPECRGAHNTNDGIRFRVEYKGMTLFYDEFVEDNDLLVRDGKVYRRVT